MRAVAVGVLGALGASAAFAQGSACVGLDQVCTVDDGTYHVLLPDGSQDGLPAIVFLHGYAANALQVMRSERIAAPLLARGYAVIAPNGRDRDGSDGVRWSFHPDFPETRDESEFLKTVRDDAIARFGFDPDRVLLGGWSIGGSMATYVACQEPESFAAYLPVAGGFWRPHPEGCAGPVRLMHTHGWTDGTVPLEGRPIGGGRIVQGDIFHTMRLFREANGCSNLRPSGFEIGEVFWQRRWQDCDAGSALELALHPGGHPVPDGWADLAIDWYEAISEFDQALEPTAAE